MGTRDERYESPRPRFVAGFLGSPSMNFLPRSMAGLNRDVTVGVRPEKLRLQRRGDHDLHIRVKLRLVEYLGSSAVPHCSAASVKLVPEYRATADPGPRPGAPSTCYRLRQPALLSGERRPRPLAAATTTTTVGPMRRGKRNLLTVVYFGGDPWLWTDKTWPCRCSRGLECEHPLPSFWSTTRSSG